MKWFLPALLLSALAVAAGSGPSDAPTVRAESTFSAAPQFPLTDDSYEVSGPDENGSFQYELAADTIWDYVDAGEWTAWGVYVQDHSNCYGDWVDGYYDYGDKWMNGPNFYGTYYYFSWSLSSWTLAWAGCQPTDPNPLGQTALPSDNPYTTATYVLDAY